MAIRILNPSDEFDHVFMTELLISQSPIHNISYAPTYRLSIAWKHYKVDPVTGDMTYDPLSAGTYYTEDFYGDAIAKYTNGDADRISALMANQAAVTEIISEVSGLTLEDY